MGDAPELTGASPAVLAKELKRFHCYLSYTELAGWTFGREQYLSLAHAYSSGRFREELEKYIVEEAEKARNNPGEARGPEWETIRDRIKKAIGLDDAQEQENAV